MSWKRWALIGAKLALAFLAADASGLDGDWLASDDSFADADFGDGLAPPGPDPGDSDLPPDDPASGQEPKFAGDRYDVPGKEHDGHPIGSDDHGRWYDQVTGAEVGRYDTDVHTV